MRWRVIYGVLWLLTVIMYSVPWAKADNEVFVGWNFTIPFSITYFIGILLGLIVLIVKYKPITMTIISGILMLLGIVGAAFGGGIATVIGGLIGTEFEYEAGIGWAFLFAIIYMVVGTYAGKKMITKKATNSS